MEVKHRLLANENTPTITVSQTGYVVYRGVHHMPTGIDQPLANHWASTPIPPVETNQMFLHRTALPRSGNRAKCRRLYPPEYRKTYLFDPG